MSKNNAAAWKRINEENLTVDAQVYGETAYVGIVTKDRTFASPHSYIKSNSNDANAIARAMSRETGVPLHPSVPPERYKQIPSHTIGRAQSKAIHDMRRREQENAELESPKGILALVIVFVVFASVFLGGLYLATWIMSLL